MNATGTVVTVGTTASDTELVAGVRAGDDLAFEELYRRYQRRISSFVRRVVRDEARAEDVTQEAFVSALRRMRATESEIAFKPWIYEIARNAAIDQWRRSSRAEEVSINQDELLRPADRARLVGAGAPEASLFQKERIDHLSRAMDELSQTHHRILVMRELEGLSYREIGEKLELSRPAVESTLFRARRRLEHEYEEIEAGRRCEAIMQAIARIAEGIESEADRRRLSRHARRCTTCRRRAREMGVEPLRIRRAAARAAALLPLPGFVRRRVIGSAPNPSSSADTGFITPFIAPTAHVGAAVAERAAALVAAVALAGAGGAVLGATSSHHKSLSAGGHHRGVAAGAHHQGRGGAKGRRAAAQGPARPALRRGSGGRVQGGAARRGGTRAQDPATGVRHGDAAPASPINAPAVPTTPKLDVPPPRSPTPPAAPTAPGIEKPSAPVSVPAAPPSTPDVGVGGIGS